MLWQKKLKKWMVEEESGQALVEYGLIIVLVGAALIHTLMLLGSRDMVMVFKNIQAALEEGVS